MLISSTATMIADPATAYAAFHDESILAATIPGVESFTRTGEGSFDVVLTMGVAAIKGTYKGTVAFSEEVEDTSFVLSAKGAGGPGTIGADISVALAPAAEGGSDITWEADAVLGGPIGGVGQRMLGGVAKRIAKKFFADIDAAIRDGVPEKGAPAGSSTSSEVGAGVLPAAAAPAESNGTVVGAPAASSVSGDAPVPAARATGSHRPCGDGFVVGAAVGASAALLGVCFGLLAGRR
ncbi:SRPBCC family protein [Brevibacterium spongiae]|jgi:carbon monoxide dehydrogenase subunit G|uniref:Carbon monoxide dehydrogenase n=1 Tax=Brevibacterium spongiae TaxID=2909672 RepID=A0ABY5SS90_9MICO|nr:SRPBCC domain-containing protein [Brevibacterium spongiae]UVI35971.1 carbon monoxide dehydrogenase [Brevibacterium spongiae]WGP06039.1 SRPBCC domain-containing protein [Bacillus subtilis]